MIKYNQALELAGFLELPEKPTEQYTYFAYEGRRKGNERVGSI
jgi:hypothetical protein